jgi:hypothetical protein
MLTYPDVFYLIRSNRPGGVCIEHDEKYKINTSVENVSADRIDVSTASTDVNARRTVVIHDRGDHRN